MKKIIIGYVAGLITAAILLTVFIIGRTSVNVNKDFTTTTVVKTTSSGRVLDTYEVDNDFIKSIDWDFDLNLGDTIWF